MRVLDLDREWTENGTSLRVKMGLQLLREAGDGKYIIMFLSSITHG